jgi:hypothetical protein
MLAKANCRPLARSLVTFPSLQDLVPDAVWQVLIPPDTGIYNHPNESETPKITLPGGIHRLKLVVDQPSANYAESEMQFYLYDADFNLSPRVLNLLEIITEQGIILEEAASASSSDLYCDAGTLVGKKSVTFEVEVLASTVPLGLFSFTPDAESADPFSFRASLYLLSSAPLPD